ncbi:MAG: AAA family ATPase, partial [Gemmataceae bacterium]
MQPLTEKYRPRRIADLLGQPNAVGVLQSFADEPSPKAFLFSGPTGTGKTSAALCLAADLGIPVERAELGGLWQIASGEQTAESVRQAVADLRVRPWEGSGWRILIVNECDRISEGAAYVWLDVLEKLPDQSVVVFTTNSPERIPQRLRDRCEHVAFNSSPADVRHGIEQLVAKVWWEELGSREPPTMEALGLAA